jgi:23S rRNA (cytosine1962-C5)-methyltransferase
MSAPDSARPVVRLLAGRHKRVRDGHPWAYSNEISMDAAAKKLAPGTLVALEAANGEPLGLAMFNPRSLIAARLLDRDPAVRVDAAYLAAKLRAALALRERLYPGGHYRLIHAEADGLPGLIVDRYGAVVVVQANAAGADRLLPELLEALDSVVSPDAVVVRNDSPARRLEGLPETIEIVKGSFENAQSVIENGASFFVNVGSGQKTGWFYDQRDNRAAVARLAHGTRVLDVYCYLGGFGIGCARAGATEVVLVDRSEPALELARRSAAANGVGETVRPVRAEAFAELERLGAAGERFDIVVADPPAFVKSRKDLAVGSRGYRKLARMAATLVNGGGFLFIASCSHNVDRATFDEQVARGLHDAGRRGRILMQTGAAADHPVHPALPESAYLKASILQLD